MLRHARHLLGDGERAKDAVQEAWLSIARDQRRLDDPARFPAWAFAIVTRRAVDGLRRAVRDRRLTDAAADVAAIGGGSDPRAAAAALLDLASALTRLPFDQQLMVSLHYGEGLSVEEIAVAHAIPAGTVKSRLHAARQALKGFLEGVDDDEG